MEPVTTSALVVGTLIANKALEKTTEKTVEALWDKIDKFLSTFKKHSPDSVVAIEKAIKQPFDYGNAVLEVDFAAQAYPEVKQAADELAAAAKAHPPSNFEEILRQIQENMEKSHNITQNVEKAVNVSAGTQYNDQSNSTFNL